MGFSFGYAFIFILAGFSAASYQIKKGPDSRWIPVFALIVCLGFSFSQSGFFYGFLTAIEYAVGFGLAHAFIKTK